MTKSPIKEITFNFKEEELSYVEARIRRRERSIAYQEELREVNREGIGGEEEAIALLESYVLEVQESTLSLSLKKIIDDELLQITLAHHQEKLNSYTQSTGIQGNSLEAYQRDLADLHRRRSILSTQNHTLNLAALKKELETLKNISKRSISLSIGKDDKPYLFVRFDDIMMTPSDNSYWWVNRGEAVHIKMPPMRVKIGLVGGSISIGRVRGGTGYHFFREESLDVHPHVCYAGSMPCLGDFGGPIAEALSDYDYLSALTILQCFLEQANTGDPAGRTWANMLTPDSTQSYERTHERLRLSIYREGNVLYTYHHVHIDTEGLPHWTASSKDFSAIRCKQEEVKARRHSRRELTSTGIFPDLESSVPREGRDILTPLLAFQKSKDTVEERYNKALPLLLDGYIAGREALEFLSHSLRTSLDEEREVLKTVYDVYSALLVVPSRLTGGRKISLRRSEENRQMNALIGRVHNLIVDKMEEVEAEVYVTTMEEALAA